MSFILKNYPHYTNRLKPLKSPYYDIKFSDKIVEFNKDLKLTNILIKDCEKALKQCFKDITYSKMPYLIYSDIKGNITDPQKKPPNSRLSARKYKSGNCVSFCYYVIDKLTEMGYDSYMISGSCPQKYAMKGYNHISHVSVIVPFDNGYILLDPTLYVKKPVILRYGEIDRHDIEHAYSNKPDDIWEFILNKGDKRNKHYSFQNSPFIMIPANTPTVETNIYKRHIDNQPYEQSSYESTFKYYLREVLNPDLSITVHTNYADDRAIVVSTDEKGNVKGFTTMNFYEGYFFGSIKKDFFEQLLFGQIIKQNDEEKYYVDIDELKKWIGCSQSHSKRLHYDNNEILANEFAQVLKLHYMDEI